MRPYIPNYSYNKLTIPELSGGVNLRDNISNIHDNQLTECKNVWFKDGMLRTRAALKTTDFNDMTHRINKIASYYGAVKIYASEKNIRVIDGFLYFLVVVLSGQDILVRYLTVENDEKPVIEVATIEDFHPSSLNVFQNDSTIYIFGSLDGDVSLADGLPIYKITEDGESWKCERVAKNKAYAPTIAMQVPPGKGKSLMDGVSYEGYNLIGNRYKVLYNTAKEPQVANQNVTTDEWSFSLLEDISKFNGEKVIATITLDGETAIHEAVVSNESATENGYNSVDNLQMFVRGNIVTFKNKEGGPHTVPRTQFVQNAIEIEAPCTNTVENMKKVFNMTFNDWYGGGSEGLYGGIHLFMGGNTEEKEKALVVWSDVNKPLYFSEACQAYAGDKTQRVTAFGKQGEMLIIAKEREMYGTEYINNSDSIVEDSVVDVTADVIFPMYQVHGTIGCDCPNTMQLCRNRLVWANSNGKVYCLASPSQYNERAIYEVSAMVERRLKEYTREELQNALTADWQGHYVLAVGGDMFLMDYNSYGFSNVYSYSKTDDAQSNIPWWIWNITFPAYLGVKSLTSHDGKLYISGLVKEKVNDYGYVEFVYMDGNGVVDEHPSFDLVFPEEGGTAKLTRHKVESEIETIAQTKFFDFGTPTTLKTIPKIEVSFGTNGGEAITASVITDKGTSEVDIYVDETEAGRYSVEHFVNKLLRPVGKHANRVGLKFQCESDMAVDGIVIQYKLLGGLK